MVKWLVILLVIGVVAGVWRLAWTSGWPHTDPPAATGGVIKDADRSNWDNASSKLSRVLAKTYPRGFASAEVRRSLRDQGFVPMRQCPSSTLQKVGSQGFACSENWDADHALHYSWGPPSPCKQDVTVFWTDDSSGRLTSIQGQYSCG